VQAPRTHPAARVPARVAVDVRTAASGTVRGTSSPRRPSPPTTEPDPVPLPGPRINGDDVDVRSESNGSVGLDLSLGFSAGRQNSRMTRAPTPRPLDLEAAFEDVLDAARSGAAWAYESLYRSLAARVCGYLRVHGAREPEDLTSELFLRVFDRLDSFDGGEAQFRSWVFTIAHRLLIDDRRRRDARPRTAELVLSVESIAGGDAESDAMRHLDRRNVEATLAALPTDQRDVLMLRVVASLTVEEVARTLDKSSGAVKALQRRGLARLRRHLELGTT
jgi:RNA polymerase sigma factor (sigma-70 family)